MKSDAQVKHKLNQVRFRHLKREIRNGLSKKASNCRHNGVVELPMYREVGVCLKGAEGADWNGGACDDSGDRASTCPLFECVHSKESIREDFDSFLRTSDRAHVGARYPDMAALLWVLEQNVPEGESPTLGEDEPTEEDAKPLPSPAGLDSEAGREAFSVNTILEAEDERIRKALNEASNWKSPTQIEDERFLADMAGALVPPKGLDNDFQIAPAGVVISPARLAWQSFVSWLFFLWSSVRVHRRG